MKSLTALLTITLCFQASSYLMAQRTTEANASPKSELSETDQRIIRQRLEAMFDKDQQFRNHLSFGTIDDEKIAEYEKLEVAEQFKAMRENKDKLSKEVRETLWEFQRKNDRENLTELASIIEEFGYPGPHRIGAERDRVFALLLHPPVSRDEVEGHTKEWCKLLLPEVKAGRMEAKSYATYVDNMRAKILHLPQLYGTNKQFDRGTGKVRPGLIEDLEATNRARRDIGMPELKEGEYLLWKNDPRSKRATRKIN